MLAERGTRDKLEKYFDLNLPLKVSKFPARQFIISAVSASMLMKNFPQPPLKFLSKKFRRAWNLQPI